MPIDRLPRPWRVCSNDDAFWVEDANGVRFGFTYFRDRDVVGTGEPKLSRDLARRVVSQIVKLGS